MALPPKKGQAAPAGRVNNYLEEMAADAQQAAEQETKPASGQFISFKNCEITVDGVKLPGAQMAFVLLDGILENRDFEFDYDAENLRNPRCFAFGRAAKEMTHHEMSEQPQCDGLCTECWANKWKSATTGSKKGKHCREIRRVAFIPAGQFLNGQFEPITDPEHYERAQIRHFHVPPTSVGEYSGYIHAVSKSMNPPRPPHSVFTRLWLEKDDKKNTAVHVEFLDCAPDELWPILKARHNEAVSEIEFPYEPMQNDEPPAQAQQPAQKPIPVGARGAQVPAKKPLPRPTGRY